MPHAARRHPPHHGDHGRRAPERRFLRPRPGPADGQEDRQPGRSERLPPVLRRRGRQRRRRPHVLRVPGRDPRPSGPGDGQHASSRASARPTRSTTGPSGSAARASRRERSGDSLAFADPEGMAHELVVVDRPDPPLDRAPPRGAGRARAAGLRGGARVQHAARVDAPRARGGARVHLRGRLGVGGARRGARRPLRARAAARGPRRPGCRHGAPRRVRLDLRGSRGVGRARARPSASIRRRSSTASTSARSTSASRAACSSRSRRSGRASPSDEPLESLGEHLSLPPGLRAPARAHRADAHAAARHPRLASRP